MERGRDEESLVCGPRCPRRRGGSDHRRRRGGRGRAIHESRKQADPRAFGGGRVQRRELRPRDHGVSAGWDQARGPAAAARPPTEGQGRAGEQRGRRPADERRVLLLPAGRDGHRRQPDEPAERGRRSERLPDGMGHVRLLRDDRQRQQLVRRRAAVPERAGRRPHRRRGRSRDRLRPRRDRLLLAPPVRAGAGRQRPVRQPLDERRVHLEPAVRAALGRSARPADGPERRLRRPRRSATSRRRDGYLPACPDE
jgi:hypothetical protein